MQSDGSSPSDGKHRNFMVRMLKLLSFLRFPQLIRFDPADGHSARQEVTSNPESRAASGCHGHLGFESSRHHTGYKDIAEVYAKFDIKSSIDSFVLIFFTHVVD